MRSKFGLFLLEGFRVGRVLHSANETISSAGNGLDKSGTTRRITQDFANLVDRGIQAVVEVNEGVGGPELVAQFFSGNDDAWTFEEECQKRKRLGLQADTRSLLAKFSGFQVGFK